MLVIIRIHRIINHFQQLLQCFRISQINPNTGGLGLLSVVEFCTWESYSAVYERNCFPVVSSSARNAALTWAWE